MFRNFGPVFFLFACTGENVIEKQQNTAPAVMIASHSPNAEILEGYIESFRATVSDDDNEFSELSVAWYVGDELVCEWTEVTPAGESFCDIVFTPDDSNVIAEVRDPQGAGGRAEVAVLITPTEAPVAEILSPTQGNGYYSNELIQFSAIVSDNEDDPEDLIITWTSSLDGELILDTMSDSSGTTSDYTYLSEGQHALELRVEDSSGKVDTQELVLQISGSNESPSCGIIAPADRYAIAVGSSVIFEGTAIDSNIESTDLTATWTSDKDGVLGLGTINSAGEVTFTYGDFSADDHIISLIVEDEVGALCQDTILLFVGTPPSASIVQPVTGDVYSVGESIIFQGTTTDAEDSSNDISIEWTSSIDGELHIGYANSQNISQFSNSTLSTGVHSISFTATDSTGLTADDLITFRINNPPTAPTVTLVPDPCTSTQNLSAVSSNSIDADGDGITYTYQWFENGILHSSVNSTIPASDLDVNDIWTVRVTPNDGYIDGPYTEATIIISNSDPTITTTSISSSDGSFIYNDSVLTCAGSASDPDETVTPTYSWDINGSQATGSAVDLSNYSLSIGDSVVCTISVLDSNGGTDSSALSETIDNRSPIISSVSVTPNPAYSSSMLTCNDVSSDADGEVPTMSYEWTINSALVGSNDTLQLDPSLVSPADSVVCTVTAIDPNGAADSNSTTITIDNTNPTVDSISFSPSEPSMNDVLSCSATASDLDGDIPVLTFAFSNQTSGLSYTSTSSTNSSASIDLNSIAVTSGDLIDCEVTATDSDGGSSIDTLNIEVINSAPIFSQASTITPNTGVVTNTMLSCSATASDPDGGNVTYSYHWQIAGQTIATGATFTTSNGQSNVGDSITCLVIAVDSDGETSTSTSTPVVMENSPPVISSALLNMQTPDTNDTLSVSILSYDLDGDSITYTYEWHILDASNGGQDSIVYTGSGASFSSLTGNVGFDRDDEVYVLVTPNDGIDNGTSVESDHAVVANTAPTAPILSLSSAVTPPLEGADDLTCAISNASSDVDGDAITYTYNWYDDSYTLQQTYANTTATQDVFLGAGTTSGTWTCDIIASDGSLTTSNSATIVVDSDWPGAVTFTSCGQTGRSGPGQSQCTNEYLGGLLEGAVTVNNGIQQWVAPSSGTYQITAVSASGGISAGGVVGLGASIAGEVQLNTGDTLYILVGQEGSGYGSGGDQVAGGGGGSFVVLENTTPLIIAGGGGGSNGSGYNSSRHGSISETGGAPAPSGGSPGSAGQGGAAGNTGGGGGGFYSDGTTGNEADNYGRAYLNGGKGGCGDNQCGGFGGGAGGGNDGAGGGGGYSGGAGNSTGYGNAGGGGSYNAGANPVSSSAVNNGIGYIIIDKL